MDTSIRKPLTRKSPDTRMAFHSSHLTPFESSTTLHNDTIHEKLDYTTSVSDSACRPALNPLGLGERIKNGLRAVLKPPLELSLGSESAECSEESLLLLDDEDESAFSPIVASKGTGAVRLALMRTPPNTTPSTVVWAPASRQPPIWGQWPSHVFSHCISVLTERDARAAYMFSAIDLPSVYECTIDCVEHLWLVVPSRPSTDGQMQLTEEQMRAAVEFYERAGTAAAIATNSEEAVNSCGSSWEGNEAGYRAEACEEGAVLLSCANGIEVDAVALAVLLLARQSNGLAYLASRLIGDDLGVSYVWKGLLGWQDVERLQATLE
jgi:hypothetical protein